MQKLYTISEKELTEMELANNLIEKQFKIMVLKMLTLRSTDELGLKKKNTENKKNQSDMRNKINEMKNMLEGINSR